MKIAQVPSSHRVANEREIHQVVVETTAPETAVSSLHGCCVVLKPASLSAAGDGLEMMDLISRGTLGRLELVWSIEGIHASKGTL